MTSGGLGTMGYGLPGLDRRAGGPSRDALVINIAGEASVADEHAGDGHRGPVPPAGQDQFILNNERLGMVRQWQELLHGERYSAIPGPKPCPTFVKLAEAFGAKGNPLLGPRRSG